MQDGIAESVDDSSVRADDNSIGKRQGSGFQEMVQMAFTSQAQKEATGVYTDYVQQYADFLRAVEDGLPLSSIIIDDLVDKIIELIAGHKDDTVQYILYGKQGASNEAENALNASIIALLIGQELNFADYRIHQLGTSTLLRDCGMFRIPRHIREKTGKFGDEELELIQSHPLHSYTIITKELGLSTNIGIPAMQHQERWDGHGYPKKLRGSEISLHARIISLADTFEAMISKRSYRTAMIGHTAMRSILHDNSRRFDPEILKVFIRTLGIYPIGSIVQLSDASIGRVMQHKPDAPLRPLIKIMIDEEGTAHYYDDGALINLEETKKLFIVKAVDPTILPCQTE